MAKQINARIITKHDKEQNWNKASSFVPKLGEIIAYETDNLSFASSVPRIKIGNGIDIIKDLPFITDTFVLKDGKKTLTTNDFTDYLKAKVLTIPENPNYENTTYSAGKDIGLDNTTFYNKGIVDIDTSTKKNTFIFLKRVGPRENDVEPKEILLDIGIDETFEDNVINRVIGSLPNYISTGAQPGTISVSGTSVPIAGLGDLAYMNYDDIMSLDSVEEISICPSGSDLITSLTKLWVNSNNGLLYYNDVDKGMTLVQSTGVKNIYPSEKNPGYLTVAFFDSAYNQEIQVGSNIVFSSTATSGPNFKVTQNGEEKTIYIDGIQNSYLSLNGGIVTGITTFSNTTASTSTTTGAVTITGGLGVGGDVYGERVHGAVFNDYAEFRNTVLYIKPGQIVCENGDGTQRITTERLQRGCNVVSDTFGFAIGETEECKTPIACAGRALVYTYENRYDFQPGEAVCSGPNGTVSRMTREEMINNPDCIIGFVSEIPEYKIWGARNVEVNDRIWIKIK